MKIIVDNLLVNYSEKGKGKVLLMLHGWGVDSSSFDKLSTDLSSEFQVVCVDLPGFGQSQVPPDSWGIEDYANFVVSFLEKIKVDQVYCLLGHSFGGRITIRLAAQDKLNPEKVIFIGAAGIKPKIGAKKLIYKSLAKTGKAATSLPGLKKLQPKLRQKLYTNAGATDYLSAGPMRKIFLNTIGEDLTYEIAHIQQPTLLIWGENDDQTPVSDAYTFHEKLSDSQLLIIPNAGHFVYLDDESTVSREIKSFL